MFFLRTQNDPVVQGAPRVGQRHREGVPAQETRRVEDFRPIRTGLPVPDRRLLQLAIEIPGQTHLTSRRTIVCPTPSAPATPGFVILVFVTLSFTAPAFGILRSRSSGGGDLGMDGSNKRPSATVAAMGTGSGQERPGYLAIYLAWH